MLATLAENSKTEVSAALPGIVIRFNKIEDDGEISRILSLIDSVFAVSLIELQENVMKIQSRTNDEEIMFYSHPYEQFCKENWSFLSKYLRQAKMD